MSLNLTGKGVQVVWAGSVIVSLLLGMEIGWKLWHPKTIHEVSAPAQRQNDGSLILEKQPNTEAKPAQQIPKGAIVERIVYVNAQPHAETITIPGSNVMVPSAQPLQNPLHAMRLDMTLIRLPDGTRRMIASSPDADITGGMDIPVEDAQPLPKELKYSAGVVLGKSSIGALITRDISFMRLGLEVTRNTYALPMRTSWEGRISLSVRF